MPASTPLPTFELMVDTALRTRYATLHEQGRVPESEVEWDALHATYARVALDLNVASAEMIRLSNTYDHPLRGLTSGPVLALLATVVQALAAVAEMTGHIYEVLAEAQAEIAMQEAAR